LADTAKAIPFFEVVQLSVCNVMAFQAQEAD